MIAAGFVVFERQIMITIHENKGRKHVYLVVKEILW
jgi:hypothetical protein